ncbi:MAG: protein-glutamate O-methyltransferase CheR [Aeromicrobium sp.]|jgi:chemotaxis methyl-accepting protein methylase|nr:protein-glutamate O-methyltransferase CheR [Aeromicrobium sp.]
MDARPADAIYRGNLTRLLEKVRDERGLDLAHYRPRYVERRIATRLQALGVHTYRQYAARLDEDPAEYARLLDALTINVTQFFRDPTVYDRLRTTVLPDLLADKSSRGQRVVRVWSAGCATGQEPYSLAMSLLSEVERVPDRQFVPSVIGTDIDRTALAVAKRGEYPVAELAHIPAADRERYVEVVGERFRFRPKVTGVVRFQHLNLLNDQPVRGVDVIFCRNVFIYLNRDQQERLLESFHDALGRGGYLVLGRSERLAPALSKRFELVDARERIYRKPRSLQ